MIDTLLENFVSDEFSKIGLKDKLTSFLVTKQKRGTYQAMSECTIIEKEIKDATETYIKEWFKTEMFKEESKIRQAFIKEIKEQIILELCSRGFGNISNY